MYVEFYECDMAFRINVACMILDVSMLHGRVGQNAGGRAFRYFGFLCKIMCNLYVK